MTAPWWRLLEEAGAFVSHSSSFPLQILLGRQKGNLQRAHSALLALIHQRRLLCAKQKKPGGERGLTTSTKGSRPHAQTTWPGSRQASRQASRQVSIQVSEIVKTIVRRMQCEPSLDDGQDRTLHATRHTSHAVRHTSHTTRYTSRHTPHVTRHVTRHTSNSQRHTSHTTRYTPHATRPDGQVGSAPRRGPSFPTRRRWIRDQPHINNASMFRRNASLRPVPESLASRLQRDSRFPYLPETRSAQRDAMSPWQQRPGPLNTTPSPWQQKPGPVNVTPTSP